jgi:hypothetical protein
MPTVKGVVIMLAACLGTCVLLDPGLSAQGRPPAMPNPQQNLRFVGSVSDGVVFFWEDGIDPNTGNQAPPPSLSLAPITTEKSFEFETGSAVVKGGTLTTLLQVDVYLRQRFYYRNAGQNRFSAYTNPLVEIESPAFRDHTTDSRVKWAVLGNGLHLATSKSLATGEWGSDNRGNFARELITKNQLDSWFGEGTGATFFANDFTVRMYVRNTVIGLNHFVVGTFTNLYGQ